jgi:hypothetical protein
MLRPYEKEWFLTSRTWFGMTGWVFRDGPGGPRGPSPPRKARGFGMTCLFIGRGYEVAICLGTMVLFFGGYGRQFAGTIWKKDAEEKENDEGVAQDIREEK